MKPVNEIRSACASLRHSASSENIFIRRISVAAALMLAVSIIAVSGFGIVSSANKNYIVTDGSAKKSFSSYSVLNKDEILKRSGISLDKNDTAELSQKSASNYMLTVTRNCEITLNDGGNAKNLIVLQTNVADALDTAGVTLGEDDVVSLSLTAPVSEGMTVSIDRVSYKTVSKTEELDRAAYEKLAKSNDKLDDSAVKEGQKGVVTHVYKNKLVNGKVEKSELIEQKLDKVTGTPTTTAKKSSSQKTSQKTSTSSSSSKTVKTAANISGAVAYASSGKNVSCISTLTPSKTILLDDKGIPVSYSKKITGSGTAYYDEYNTGLTSTGVKPQPGYVAVDPREIPYGTKMYIRSSDGRYNYGYAIAADTGGFIYNSSTVVDLFFYTRSEVYNFGRRNVEIYILN